MKVIIVKTQCKGLELGGTAKISIDLSSQRTWRLTAQHSRQPRGSLTLLEGNQLWVLLFPSLMFYWV